MRKATDFLRETIDGITGPCASYHGMVAAISTPGGKQIVVMAADLASLVAACREIAPTIVLNTAMCDPASIVHDRYVIRKDNEVCAGSNS